MAKEMQKTSMFIERNPVDYENGDICKNLDDDGRVKRTGSYSSDWIWSPVSCMAIAQLGWVAGPAVLMAFSFIAYFTSTLLADCYRAPDPVHGKRNYTYMDIVRAYLGGRKVQLCGLAQAGPIYVPDGRRPRAACRGISFTKFPVATKAISGNASQVSDGAGAVLLMKRSLAMQKGLPILGVFRAVKRSNCFHKHGHQVKCQTSYNPFMVIFACIQIFLSQIPNFHNISWLSILAAVMSFAYSSIGLGLSIAKVAGGEHVRTTLTGVTVGVGVSGSEKIWRTFQAIGDIAFAYAYSTILDMIKSSPPENKSMKTATTLGVSTTTLFYVVCGLVGYAAFGKDAPGNFLTGFGFYEPFWLIDFANICIAIHLIGAYQAGVEDSLRYSDSRSSHDISFLQQFLGTHRAGSFWPLTVYFPIEMHIAQTKLPKYSFRWIWLKILSWVCLIVSLIAAAGSVQGLIQSLKTYKPFQTQDRPSRLQCFDSV
ncbi:Amino acid permease 6 [Hibiscus syriacus]|uniref:Amino acid permease 6 n=1 Tax=Hibiscus syriacus TaxID=106335 RepID=A0A6A3BI70_HIBSY|nr:Amino acid permease 6 [Hibiscus syriacus]